MSMYVKLRWNKKTKRLTTKMQIICDIFSDYFQFYLQACKDNRMCLDLRQVLGTGKLHRQNSSTESIQ